MVSILFLCYFAASTASGFCQVKYGKASKSIFDVAVYSCITCVIATLFFYGMSGFSPQINKQIVIYALAYTAVVICAQYLGLLIIKYMDVLKSGIIRNSVGLILTFILGGVLFEETVDAVSIFRMLLSFGAVVSLFLHKKGNKGQQKEIIPKKQRIIGYIICAILILTATLGNIISKMFSSLRDTTDENAYFMLVNIFTFFISFLFTLALKKCNLKVCAKEVAGIGIKGYAYIVISTVGSNLVSLLQIWILASGAPIVLYTPVTAALEVLVQVIVAKFAANEKIPPIPVALSLASALLLFIK